MSNGRDIARGGPSRSVTVTFGYGEELLHSLVAPTLRRALAAARRRWGEWETIESISTPNTIMADLSGLTRARLQPGVYAGGPKGTACQLRQSGHEVRPGEVGSVRYSRDELPTIAIPRRSHR